MPIDFDQAEKNINALTIWYRDTDHDHRNEATTRLQLIDRLLFECLGWDRDECIAEERLDNGYTDYSLNCPECLLIVEAKKEGNYFELPAGIENIKYNI